MRLTKIYTKVGDKGSTHLASGAKVKKSEPRIEAYGTVDELNAQIGFLRDLLTAKNKSDFMPILAQLKVIQNELFDVGGELSTPASALNIDKQQVVKSPAIERLETEIDDYNEHLEPLKNFVLPGGCLENSAAHIARTVCRRAERMVVRLAEVEEIRSDVMIYLNRLSDWLFVVGRKISQIQKTEEIQWQQKK